MVSDDPEIVYTTVLGSCIAVCLFDIEAGIGGMNHFLLPHGVQREKADLRYGVHSMELLVSALLDRGAERARLRAKVFGGSNVTKSGSNIGDINSRFIKSFLMRAKIKCLAADLGGKRARKIRFEPTSGKVQVRLLPALLEGMSDPVR